MNDNAVLKILEEAFEASLKIVDKYSGQTDRTDGRIIAASNLAISLFSFEIEALSTDPPDEDDSLEGLV